MAQTAFWVFHGAIDPTVPVDYSRKMVEALRKTGAGVQYTEYPNVKHNSWSRAYGTDKLWEWMFARERPGNPETRTGE